MLTTLRIKNLALVADLTLELQPGCNVVTGETGAGKSIIIGALNLVLGERADRTLLRSGADSCSVEAVFDVATLPAHQRGGSSASPAVLANFLEQNGLEPCEDGQLVLKRTFTSAGANRQFVNGSPTTLHVLATLGEWLVDMHGPHDHQSLLHPARQLAILDAFGGLEAEREAFGQLVGRRAALATEKTVLIVDEQTYAQQLDLLRFQVAEIEAARLQPDEEEQLTQEHHRASNAAKLLQLSQAALDLLSENETAVLTEAGIIGRTLQELGRVDPGAAPLMELHEQAMSTLRDLQGELSRYADKVEVDPARLAELEERLDLIHSLKRKYGATLPEVIAHGASARRKLQSLESRDAELARLNAELARLDQELAEAGQALTAKRRRVIPQLTKAVARQLAELGFQQSKFDAALTPRAVAGRAAGASAEQRRSVLDFSADENASRADSRSESQSRSRRREPALTSPQIGMARTDVRGCELQQGNASRQSGPSDWHASGLDEIEFLFAPNPGEPARPLRAIASSGEMARVMLALKTVLAAQDEIPVLIFDEVDANVGGETANAVGEKMKQIAARRQVICITHLPQVAAPADAHYVVTKQVKEGRTISEITLLDRKARVTELARMLGGQSDAARKHAEALLRSPARGL